jgi:exopolysaccharide biosynthesis WecB/TagA/CpsF family protein
MAILQILLLITLAVFLIPIGVFSIECLLASIPTRRGRRAPAPGTSVQSTNRPRVAVLIPAHNEQYEIRQTLQSIMPQLAPGDRAVVVADNCTDATANVARGAGALVLERHDTSRRGKGYALDFGVRHLEADPPAVLVQIDADSHVHDGTIEALANAVHRTGRPAQSVNLLDTPPDPSAQQRVSAFAFRVKNLVRPLGLSRLGLPCLTSTGVAFPWPVIRDAHLASGNIVEDMQLGIDMAIAGHPAVFCPDAHVTGRLPSQQSAATTQRTRWEHGHLQTIRAQVPRLLWNAARRLRPQSLAIALELSVPPLSLLVLAWTAVSTAICAASVALGWWTPVLVVSAAWLAFAAALMAAWARFGREVLPARSLVAIPAYALRKLPLYKAFLRNRETAWVRTARDGEAATATPAQVMAGQLLADAAARDTSLGLGHDPHTDLPHRVGRPRVAIGQTLIDNLTMDEAIETIEALIYRRRPTYVVTPNVDHVVKLQSQPAFRDAYRDAGLVLADGMPLLWAARLLRTPLKQKVSGSDLFPKFCDVAGRKGYRLFFLGGRPGAAAAAADKFRASHPGVQIACLCPPMGFDRDPAENRRVIDAIRAYQPDVLFVGLGAPKQEHWMHRHHAECGVPVSIGIGASFDFVAGHVRRAPVVFQRTGFEWAWRLAAEPRRMYRRYLLDDPQFFSLVWRQWRGGRPDAGPLAAPAPAPTPAAETTRGATV